MANIWMYGNGQKYTSPRPKFFTHNLILNLLLSQHNFTSQGFLRIWNVDPQTESPESWVMNIDEF